MRTAMFYLILILGGLVARPYLYPVKPLSKVAAQAPLKIEGLVVHGLNVLEQKALEIKLDQTQKSVLLYDADSKVLPPAGSHISCMARAVQTINLNGRNYVVYQLVSSPPPPPTKTEEKP